MFRAVIVGPYQDELAEGFGSTKTEALADAKSSLDVWGLQVYATGACFIEFWPVKDAVAAG